MDSSFGQLLNEAAVFKRKAYSENTKSTYRSHLNAYMRFCLYFDRVPVPADQMTLKTYVAFLARSIKPCNINNYLNIIRILHSEAGLENPLAKNWELDLIKRGIARQLGSPPSQKLPITVPILKAIRPQLNLELPSDLAFWSACLVAFFGLLRKSSLVPKTKTDKSKCLLRKDVINMQTDSVVINVRSSKTNQFGLRVHQIPFASCADPDLCPVQTLLMHLTKSSLPGDQPLFSFLSNNAIHVVTHAIFVSQLRDCLKKCGLVGSAYSGHSFRRGGCSACFAAGMSIIDIKQRGDWRSAAVERYIHVTHETLFGSARLLSHSVSASST